MPPIDLLEPDGSLGLFAPTQVLAVTCYPEDESKRSELLAGVAITALVELGKAEESESIDVPVSWLEVLLGAPSFKKIGEGAALYTRNSWIAGEMLLFLLSAAVRHPELDVTPTKAVWLIPRIFEGVEAFSGGTVSFKQRTTWTAWGRFKAVAHFHAVRQIWLEDKTRATGPDLGTFARMSVEKLIEHLALAEALRRVAVERKIIKHADTWFTPPSLKLPPVQLEIPPLPDSALKELAKYSPEHSSDSPFLE